jgi:hypothetical protein
VCQKNIFFFWILGLDSDDILCIIKVYLTTTLVESKMAEMTRREMREKIQVGSRVRWKPVWNEPGLVGHEGTVVTLGHEGPGWAWVRYDDGTEKAAHLSELELI